jgi:hypothetical protein
MLMPEKEGIFVIQYITYDDRKRYLDDYNMPTQDVNRAQLFETRTKAFHHLLKLGLIKRCLVQEIKD